MPRKRPEKAEWSPPPSMKVEVAVSRGDVSLRSEAPSHDTANVALFLLACINEVAKRADVLPIAESVPGGVLPYFDDGDTEGKKVKRVGF